MSKAPEQIWAEPGMPGYLDCPNELYTVQYTRTDVAQAMVAAAYEAAKKAAFHACKSAGSGYVDENEHLLQRAENEFRLEVVTAIRALTPTDAKVALDRIVQEAVKEAFYRAEPEIRKTIYEAHMLHSNEALERILSALKGG